MYNLPVKAFTTSIHCSSFVQYCTDEIRWFLWERAQRFGHTNTVPVVQKCTSWYYSELACLRIRTAIMKRVYMWMTPTFPSRILTIPLSRNHYPQNGLRHVMNGLFNIRLINTLGGKKGFRWRDMISPVVVFSLKITHNYIKYHLLSLASNKSRRPSYSGERSSITVKSNVILKVFNWIRSVFNGGLFNDAINNNHMV